MNMLPITERLQKLNQLQQATIEDIKISWEINNGVVCIRPTGFGKTFTAGRLLRETDENGSYAFKNIVFICPRDTVMTQFNNELLYEGEQKKQIPCCIYRNGKKQFEHPEYNKTTGVTIRELTYALVARRFGHDESEINGKSREERVKDVFGEKVDLIVLDEFHNAGGDKTLIGLMMVLDDFFKDTLKLGLTATYDRTDRLDVGYELFGNMCLTPEYTYAQAVDDGVLPAIRYFCNDYKSVKDTHEKLKELDKLAETNQRIALCLAAEKRKFKQNTNLVNMHTVIRNDTIEVIGRAYADTYSQKWIIFYPNCDDLLKNWKRVENWYKKAWPEHEVRSIIVIDRPEYKNNHKVVCAHGYHKFNPRKEEKVVVLIFNVNMLLEAVHLDNVTGLLLFTCTKSPVKYYQTLGRVIDSKRETEPLVIDMMDGYNELFKRLQQDIEDAKEGKQRATRQANTINTGNTDIGITGEQSNILTKLKVESNQLTYNEFYTRLVKLSNLTKLRRAALEVMNKHIGLALAARAEGLPLTMLVNEIKTIQANQEFVASEVMVSSKAKNHTAVKKESTGIFDPFSEEEYINVVYSENGFMDADDYDAILNEYENIQKHITARKAGK